MEGLETFTLTKEEATKKWKEAIDAEKRTADRALQKQLHPLRTIYRRLRDGKSVVDVFASMKKVPLNSDGEPRLAIFPLGSKTVHFRKQADGGGVFGGTTDLWRAPRFDKHVVLPAGTFGTQGRWPIEHAGKGVMSDRRMTIQTLAAPVPPRFVPERRGPYFVLQEVDRWEPEPTKDPALLYRATNNLFVIEAEWDLSPLERAFIRGTL